MGRETGISWTDSTWNPIRGCSRVSEGCRHLLDPLKWKPVFLKCDVCGVTRYQCLCEKFNHRARRIFVNSMSDLFHENVTDEMRDRIFGVMALCPQHTFQVLTKRPERMLAYFNRPDDRVFSKIITNPCAWFVWREVAKIQAVARRPIPSTAFAWTEFSEVDTVKGWPLPNVHLGVSVEDQRTADERIPLLLQTPAAVRFISAEPLVGPVDLLKTEYLKAIAKPGWQNEKRYPFEGMLPDEYRTKLLHLLDWVIAGGESGAGARPMHPDWARSLRDQCKAAGVPFFFKQWGEWAPGRPIITLDRRAAGEGIEMDDVRNEVLDRIGTKAAGCLLDGVEHHEFPVTA
jgi:protein gp37